MGASERVGSALSVAQAADALGLSRSRVDALVRSGRVRSRRIGHQHVIDDLSELSALPRRSGRPMSARMAWALLLFADGRPVEWVAPTERTRLRKHVARLRADPEPEVLLQALVVNRANRIALHGTDPASLSADDEVVVSGISDERSGLSAGPSFEGYVHVDDLRKVMRRHLLVEPAATRPNVWLHVTEYLPATSTRLQVAADLAEHGSPRERSRARELVHDVVGRVVP